jgi:anti-sigma regulatory factor (Ser/Thr protein kinase)
MGYGRGLTDDVPTFDQEASRPMDSVEHPSDPSSPDACGAAGGPEPATVELELPARVDLVAVARMVVAAAASCGSDFQAERLDDLRLMTSEAATNAVEANLATERPGRVSIEAAVNGRELTLSVSDEGAGMTEVPASLPDLEDRDGLRREGGFGLPLMRMLSSEPVVFISGENGTTVRMRLGPQAPSERD